ncbi:MAG: endolytic transglycosylase MltG [Candidatus Liptonbacteria bacterium]
MRKLILLPVVFFLLVMLGATSFFSTITPRTYGDSANKIQFEVTPGESARTIASKLEGVGLIKSSFGFYVTALLSGDAFGLKPGEYEFSSDMSARAIINALVNGPDLEREVVIREGATIYDVDAALADAGVLSRHALIDYAKGSDADLEGYLFPDTYRFYVSSTVTDVVGKMLVNFNQKAAPLLPKDPTEAHDALVIASLIEKEIPLARDRQIVAGIFLKRLHTGMPLQVDATVCYMKEVASGGGDSCLPLTPLDFTKSSPYNTYIVKGLPPQPIGNPGKEAIEAALHPIESPYWFYLSEPGDGQTIFATTLDEHNRNRVKYLTR